MIPAFHCCLREMISFYKKIFNPKKIEQMPHFLIKIKDKKVLKVFLDFFVKMNINNLKKIK